MSYTPYPNWENQIELEGFLDSVGQAIMGGAVTRCAYDTGNLQRSITYEVVGGSDPYVVIWATAHYSIFVELGTRYMDAQPFLRPAMMTVVAQIGGTAV